MQNHGPAAFPPLSNGSLGDQAEYITPISKDSLQLIVGHESLPTGLRKLIVSRPHVTALSAVFHEISKRRNKKTKQVLLPEDDADMIRLIMLIAHLQSMKLPQDLDLNELVRLALVVERYKVGHILSPYLDAWLAPHRQNMFDPGYEQWLFVTYHFGLEEEYLLLANHLVLHCHMDEDFDLVHPATGHQVIKMRRSRLIAQMLDATYNVLGEMRVSNHCRLVNTPTRSQTQCTALNKLRLERYLTAHKMLPPLQHASEMRSSPMEVLQKLLDATIIDANEPYLDVKPVAQQDLAGFLQYDQLHEDCTVGTILKARLDHIMETRLLGAEKDMMNKIREHAGQYNRFPFHGYDEAKLVSGNDEDDDNKFMTAASPGHLQQVKRYKAESVAVDSVTGDGAVHGYDAAP
ncbi:hypothetical protein BKA66DRAFT_567951 [Pyrenochaeta sp. MPI-SDFR-AT-0127]|nr:hypothetical protein BKA66DRAFT_567951 [Pyrenochaeta sp. MPI-SDFR-AT-0127]